MKRKYRYILGTIIAAMSLSSCGFPNIFKPTLDKLTVTNTREKSYFLVGQSYFDYCELSITGKYSDGSSKEFTYEQVSFSLTLNGESYDIYSPFTTAGVYSLLAKKDGVKSNKLSIKVFADEQYVSSISYSTTTVSLVANEHKTIDLTVSPEEFTVDITAQSSDESIVTAANSGAKSFDLFGVSAGNATVTFKALTNATEYVEFTLTVSVSAIQKTTIQQTYNTLVKHSAYNVSACPTKGDVKILIIPVWFTDSGSFINSSKKEGVRQDIGKAYLGTTEETGWHSVSTYYYEESRGSLRITGTLSDWYSASCTAAQANRFEAEYDDYGYKTADPQSDLVKAATNWYFNNNSDSRRNYDYDGDGYLDGVILIYGAPDYVAKEKYGTKYSNGKDNLWAYCYWIQESSQKSTSNPGVNVFFWASYDFIYGTNIAQSKTGSKYCSGDTSHTNIDGHTFIHEMGHVFGLEDYYDYVKTGALNPAASFSMQDHNIGGHDPYSVMSLGWANPYIPSNSCNIVINDFQSSGDMILLTPTWNGYNSPFDEYLLLELYTPTGLNKLDCDYQYTSYPQGPRTAGIRLWHVDARLVYGYRGSSYTGFTVNANSSNVVGAFNNTSSAATRKCAAGESYQSLNLLQLIRNNKSATYLAKDDLSTSSLFRENSSFTMSDYAGQFVKNGKLDKNVDLDWEFSVEYIIQTTGGYSAKINLTKV